MRLLIMCLLFTRLLHAQSFQSFYTGDTTDVTTSTQGGIVLMGGATEDDNAMRWFLQRSGGGDIVVIRTSGSDGYNDYLYSDLGVTVNSVETILMPNFNSAQDPYVAQHIRNAEALWIAGGDQGKYVQYWKNGPVEDAIKYLIHTKKAVIGGTSAGMAIMGEAYFSALNGSVTSAEALANPYNSRMTIGYADFLDHPDMQHVITDTHYDSPDRRGRQVAFLARLAQDQGIRALGIACEEYTAVCIDTSGWARVYGGYPQDSDYAYFLQTDCSQQDFGPENCTAGQPLQWVRSEQAVRVFKAEGRSTGQVMFNIRDWKSTSGGGVWQRWWVESGALQTASSTAPDCLTDISSPDVNEILIGLTPNPVRENFQLQLPETILPVRIQIIDLHGKTVHTQDVSSEKTFISVEKWQAGMYFLRINKAGKLVSKKLIIP